MKTTIEVSINGVTIFRHVQNRQLSDTEIRRIRQEGCIGIDKTKAVITTKFE